MTWAVTAPPASFASEAPSGRAAIQRATADSIAASARDSRRRAANGYGEKFGPSDGTGTLLSYIGLPQGEPVQERRLGYRIPYEAMVTSYVHDRPIRGLSQNLSDTGINMSAISLVAPPPGLVVGLEIDLPGIDESIWASGQICYRKDDRMASGLGVRFVAMAKSQARMIRDFCIEARRKNLGSLLARIRA
ncbi:MAG: PilZ domain-containing protein [Myxococcales bacterium]|nr:PilZ domain-containing protein [Myxococcales bacterium]